MKYVYFPEDVELKNPETGDVMKTVVFTDWLKFNILRDNKWGKTAETLLMSADIQSRLEKAVDKEHNHLTLSDQEWSKLWEVANEPSGGYIVAVMQQMSEFLLAIKNPEEEER